MPNTYSQIFIRIVFAKGRQNLITENVREETQKYISGIIATETRQKLDAIYCMPDHTRILASIQPDLTISNLVKDIKSNSSSWLKNKFSFLKLFSWQEGFGCFSYSKSQSHQVVNYILNQTQHHKKKTFRQEYIEFNNRYLFEFYD